MSESEMTKITYKIDGKDYTVWGCTGESLLELAKRMGIKIYGMCDGAGVCGTCRVYIQPEFMPGTGMAHYEEVDLLKSMPEYQPNLRLACSVIVSKALEGVTVTVP